MVIDKDTGKIENVINYKFGSVESSFLVTQTKLT